MAVAASAAATTRKVVIDIVSDTICPWCYVGKRRLEKAIAAVQKEGLPISFDIRWHPFFLDPSLPKEGMDKLTMYKAKFGEARTASIIPYMMKVGADDGISFKYGGKVANTLDSHRLMELAYEEGGAALQDKVCEALMSYYFEQEGNLGDKKGMLKVVTAAGLDEARATALLDSDAKVADVNKAVTEWASKHRITGVPFFLIDGKYKLSGAPEVKALSSTFKALVDE